MDSLQPAANPSADRRLRRSDFLLLILLCTFLFGFSLVEHRVLTTHEAVHCLNVREMFQSGEWFIPTYGGRPWLERPPLPHWLTGVFASLCGDLNQEWSMRVGSIVISMLTVVIFAWTIAGIFGRVIGLMSGAILATTREFASYAVGPEADIFLACTVILINSIFLKLQFGLPKNSQTPCTFFGKRPPLVLLFFILLALTNWMKGPLFGMTFVMLPMAGYLIWTRSFVELKPFIWFWGWLLTVVVGAAWSVYALQRYPDILDLWLSDYGGRWESGYIGEPAWYYFVFQPWSLFPWTGPFFIGLTVRLHKVSGADASAGRFVCCWAIVPLLFFSLFKGKHHHYLLSCLAPCSVFCAVGAIKIWGWLRLLHARFRSPLFAAMLVGIPAALLVFALGRMIPGPGWVHWFAIISCPALAALLWRAICHREGRGAFNGLCAVILLIHCLMYCYRAEYLDRYRGDTAFLQEVNKTVSDDRPLLVVFDDHPLTSSWLMYYLGDRWSLLHNLTFLRDDRLDVPEVFLICRCKDEDLLKGFGKAELILKSSETRAEEWPGDRWALYSLRFHPHLERMNGNVRISPLQATGRKAGPYLTRSLAVESNHH